MRLRRFGSRSTLTRSCRTQCVCQCSPHISLLSCTASGAALRSSCAGDFASKGRHNVHEGALAFMRSQTAAAMAPNKTTASRVAARPLAHFACARCLVAGGLGGLAVAWTWPRWRCARQVDARAVERCRRRPEAARRRSLWSGQHPAAARSRPRACRVAPRS